MLNAQIRYPDGRELRAFSKVNIRVTGAFLCSETSESESEALLSDAMRSGPHGLATLRPKSYRTRVAELA